MKKLALVAAMAALLLAGCSPEPPSHAPATPTKAPASEEMTPAMKKACTPRRGEPDWDALTLCRELVMG